jgi:glutamate N-acetyltransferase/amino-acid N-acetyltransferase
MVNNGITAPIGFLASGVSCGLKNNGKKDLAMVLSENLAIAAGVFTTNVVKGHSLLWTKSKVQSGHAKAMLINSGCANACLGTRGDNDAADMALYASSLIECNPDQVMLGSTGVIGFPLDMDKIKNGIKNAFASLSNKGGAHAAEAIMTTDTFPKEASKTFKIDDKTITIGGMCKGSGMIHPNMATMISLITTDVAISHEMLDKALRYVSDKSFNRVSVDGDTSVCDQLVILANGQGGNKPITSEDSHYEAFISALLEVAESLSKMLARDGEGATKLIEIRVKGCEDATSAHLILNTIAKSPLVKTAFFGQDANWGRIFTAAGYSGVNFNPDLVDIYLGDLKVCSNGAGLSFDEEKASEILKKAEIIVTIDFKSGPINDRIWTCDLSFDYVKINGSYRS